MFGLKASSHDYIIHCGMAKSELGGAGESDGKQQVVRPQGGLCMYMIMAAKFLLTYVRKIRIS